MLVERTISACCWKALNIAWSHSHATHTSHHQTPNVVETREGGSHRRLLEKRITEDGRPRIVSWLAAEPGFPHLLFSLYLSSTLLEMLRSLIVAANDRTPLPSFPALALCHVISFDCWVLFSHTHAHTRGILPLRLEVACARKGEEMR